MPETARTKPVGCILDGSPEPKWEFRFNTPAFGFPSASVGSPTVGRITSTIADNRDLQFALKLES